MDFSKLSATLSKPEVEPSEKYIRKPTPFVKISPKSGDYSRFILTDTSYRFKIDEKWYNSVINYLAVNKDLKNIQFDDILTGYLAKFRACWELKRMLIATGNTILIYCDPEDNALSCGFAADDANADKPHTWTGKNLLGYVLMQLRCELKEDWKAENLSADGNVIKRKKANE